MFRSMRKFPSDQILEEIPFDSVGLPAIDLKAHRVDLLIILKW